MAAIWSDVLGLSKAGIRDDFFELGGHSLLAAQLAARICKEFAVELRLGAIFEAPSISQLSAHVQSAMVDRAVAVRAGDDAWTSPAGGRTIAVRSNRTICLTPDSKQSVPCHQALST